MNKEYSSVVEKPLHAWVLGKNRWLQSALVIAAVGAALANVIPLEMQKRIVNDAIKLKNMHNLIWYCGFYLAAVTASTALKYLIGVLQTLIAQRTLCSMRLDYYRHMLTLPLTFYRSTQSGLVVSALTKELATAGDYSGMAIAVPASNGLLLAAFGGYLFWLNPFLAFISLSIYPLVLILVPFLQRRVNIYNRKRVDATRKMASKLGESVDGIHEIQANAAFPVEEKKFRGLIQDLKRIRILWKIYKHAVKRVNSLFTNFGRFLVFAVGGYLVIKGGLELGALVAFLSAQEKLYDPWKELIEFYQAHQIAQVTYNRTTEYFDAKPEHSVYPRSRELYDLAGNIEVENLSLTTEDGVRLLSDIQFSLNHGEHMAVVGSSGSGKSTLAKCMVQLQKYSAGRIRIDEMDVSRLTKADIARNVGYVSQHPFIFEGTIEENLFYGLLTMQDEDGKENGTEAPMVSRDDKILVLQQTGLFPEVLRFGLDAFLDKKKHDSTISQILAMRKKFLHEYREKLSDIIEFYDRDKFLYYSSLAENILFDQPERPSFRVENLPENDVFLEVINESGLKDRLMHWGKELADILIKSSRDPSAEKDLRKFEILEPGEVDEYEKILYRLQKKGMRNISRQDRGAILRKVLRYVPGKHDLLPFPKDLEDKILDARKRFERKMGSDPSDDVEVCRIGAYLHAQPILTNIFFGKIKDDSEESRKRIDSLIKQVLIEKEFLEDIVELGMQYHVGRKGDNLSGGQKQKLAIARALLKKPSILVMDEATSSLDNESQSRIQTLLETSWKKRSSLIGVVHRLDIIKDYDKVAVLRGGKIEEIGAYDDLMGKRGALFDLVEGKNGG